MIRLTSHETFTLLKPQTQPLEAAIVDLKAAKVHSVHVLLKSGQFKCHLNTILLNKVSVQLKTVSNQSIIAVFHLNARNSTFASIQVKSLIPINALMVNLIHLGNALKATLQSLSGVSHFAAIVTSFLGLLCQITLNQDGKQPVNIRFSTFLPSQGLRES